MKYNKGCLWLSYAKIIEEDILIEKNRDDFNISKYKKRLSIKLKAFA
ncbi:hypothetical protein [Tenacibaculum larymnensis]|uniref:Uncharacterized protein n=1 Tax=Tenacibaculum larymnensis TaxID=2878201 RepID=A0A9X4IQY8_9FLAO|nr:hypothetical protein [Tenacibaculum larymnensis]MDE1207686.1 hypothetical protein [Tenacibaculum larymnensis]